MLVQVPNVASPGLHDRLLSWRPMALTSMVAHRAAAGTCRIFAAR
jgi:hypothetical protein